MVRQLSCRVNAPHTAALASLAPPSSFLRDGPQLRFPTDSTASHFADVQGLSRYLASPARSFQPLSNSQDRPLTLPDCRACGGALHFGPDDAFGHRSAQRIRLINVAGEHARGEEGLVLLGPIGSVGPEVRAGVVVAGHVWKRCGREQ